MYIDSLNSTKLTAEFSVGLQPTVACEIKRAGFLEGEAIGTSQLIGL